MKPYTRSIIELFDGKKRYLIPLYQRQYAWNIEPQLRLLWDDIHRAYDRLVADRATVVPHFMGAMVIAQVKTYGKQVQAFEVIDGQQRLTTFQLLLAALRDIAAKNGSSYAAEIQKYLINEGIMEIPQVERFKVWPSLMDRRAFTQTIDPNVDIETISRQTPEDGFIRKAVKAHEWFCDKINTHVGTGDQFDESKLEKLFEAMKEGLAVVSIELEGGDDPQTIFETLNSRGVDLAPGDLMRNFIFQRAKGLGQEHGVLKVDELYEKHWLPLDSLFWNSIVNRGRQAASRLDWMLTDHLSMKKADIVSKENLFDHYRRWIVDERPFGDIKSELESITASASVEQRIFERNKDTVIGKFGMFAEAFDVSTVFPLVVYLATEAEVGNELPLALSMLESYILRRDVSGLPTKSYNRFFVGTIDRLREIEGDKIEALARWLATRPNETDRWPNDTEFKQAWLARDQYKSNRQPRLRYIFEQIEKAKRSALSEEIEIRSQLTVEHIMPQHWRENWPIPGFDHLEEGDLNIDHMTAELLRDGCVNKMGNLTLVTSPLNSSMSHGPFLTKLNALRANASLALNRELNNFDRWDEACVNLRGTNLFEFARKIWIPPQEIKSVFPEFGRHGENGNFPRDGTICRFQYGDQNYRGLVKNRRLEVEGFLQTFSSFSGASVAVTDTNRNGWRDWEIKGRDGWVLADIWRNKSGTVAS
ncbi:DUF262 domain-containing protein [Asticcacaulis sp. AND118]|uniref:DUF262 domain-containing protein n=1 Tax=Asticcacaulis sp. AND118 TaxID=2840468 RepID=UPI001CFFE210|nr:DUF262 domain-containing protein [Asticcacaulis sp. AND118]UDF02771.1 DUF262 domain-containing HNH endonuclease family protein [Asticcacaulis sp. AND118]